MFRLMSRMQILAGIAACWTGIALLCLIKLMIIMPRLESGDSQAPADGKEEETRDAAKAEAEEKQDEAGEKADGEKTPETASDDNFSVASSDAEEFARQIKEAVAGKDLEGLAELAAYPLYIAFPDGGKSLESKEEFVALFVLIWDLAPVTPRLETIYRNPSASLAIMAMRFWEVGAMKDFLF